MVQATCTSCFTVMLGLSLLCSKVYLLFFPKFPKDFTYYSFFKFLYAPYYSDNNAHLVTIPK